MLLHRMSRRVTSTIQQLFKVPIFLKLLNTVGLLLIDFEKKSQSNEMDSNVFQKEDAAEFLKLYEKETRITLRNVGNEMLTLYAPNIYKIMEAIFESLPQSKSISHMLYDFCIE